MKNKFILSVIFVLIGTGLIAQDFVFRTLATRGENAVQRSASADKFEPIKTGTKIFKGDKIVVNADSYLGLSAADGKTIEIKEEGIYNVDDLAGNITSDNSSIASRYIAYIFDDLSKGSEANNANMSITGSVERSLNNAGINVFLPNSTKVIDDDVSVMWSAADSDAQNFTLKIFNFFDEVVFEKTTTEDKVDINLADLGLENEEIYKLQVVNADDPSIKSGDVSLHVPSEAEAKELSELSSTVDQEIGEESAVKYMIMASFYVQNELYINAVPMFEKAIELEPEVEEFKTVYNNFKTRYGIVDSVN